MHKEPAACARHPGLLLLSISTLLHVQLRIRAIMADGFSREISRVVVGQLAEIAGYESVQDSAAEVLGGFIEL